MKAVAFGVGNDPDAESLVVGPNGVSRNFKRRRDFVASGLQTINCFVETHPVEPNNVLTNDPSGLRLFNNAEHVWPEPAVILVAQSLSSVANWLAGEASADEIDPSVLAPVELGNVVVNRDAWPAFGEEGAQGWLPLAEGNRSEAAGEFKAVAKSADSAEQVNDI